MTTYLQGQTATLVVEWREYAPNGPLVDVDNQAITIEPLAGGAPVVGPTSVGIAHPATGVYVYNWAVPSGQTPADYLVIWEADDAGTGDPVSASEVITIAGTVSGSFPTGLCEPWEPIWCCATALSAEAMAVTGTAVAAATEALWQASGQRFGLCQVTIRPCRRDCGGGWPSGNWWEWSGSQWPHPYLYDGQWFNLGCGGCSGLCSCTVLEETLLPGVVYDIVQVKIDGIPLPPTAYRLDDGRLLTRVDGGRWPICQDMAAEDTEAGTWSVTARFGQPVPTLGRQAVGELACEMARACAGEDCLLPKNIQNLVRQGVSISFPEGEDLARRGYFGNMFLDTYNPRKLSGRPVVYDVDGSSFRRTGI